MYIMWSRTEFFLLPRIFLCSLALQNENANVALRIAGNNNQFSRPTNEAKCESRFSSKRTLSFRSKKSYFFIIFWGVENMYEDGKLSGK